MRRHRKLAVLAAIVLASAVPGRADVMQEEPPRPLKDVGEISFIDTSGNTTATTFNLKNELSYSFRTKTKVDWTGSFLYAKAGGITSAEQYQTGLRVDQNLTDRIFGFVLGGWQRDRFAGILDRYNGGAGAGLQVFKTGRNDLRTDAGFNYIVEERSTGETKRSPSALADVNYRFNLTAQTSFGWDGKGDFDLDDTQNYQLESLLSLQTSLTKILAWKNSYLVRYKHEPVPGFGSTDRTFSTAMVINF